MTTVLSPLAGRPVPLAEVPDPVFSAGMLGPGIAVHPAGRGEVDALAPVDGVVTALQPHACVVTGADGVGVLVHLGLDTVRLRGVGFTAHVAAGDAVRAGQPLVRWSPDAVAAGGLSPLVVVVLPGLVPDAVATVAGEGEQPALAPLLEVAG